MVGLVPILFVVIFGRVWSASELFPYGDDAGDVKSEGGATPSVPLSLPMPYANGATTPDIVVSYHFLLS